MDFYPSPSKEGPIFRKTMILVSTSWHRVWSCNHIVIWSIVPKYWAYKYVECKILNYGQQLNSTAELWSTINNGWSSAPYSEPKNRIMCFGFGYLGALKAPVSALCCGESLLVYTLRRLRLFLATDLSQRGSGALTPAATRWTKN
jgi:hypothetical protein